MIKYKTSDLYKRALQLADLEGSNFISWNEASSLINESYIGLYQKLINMGDNSFVKSFKIGRGKTELPKDFWQLKGVYLWNNGNLQTINRRADNNSIHFTSYELRNGSIELFGSAEDVLVEYYPTPMTLYFPPKEIEIDLSELPEGAEVLDCHEHIFLYSKNSLLNVYDLDGLKSCESGLSVGDFNYITKDYVISIDSGVMSLYNLASGASGTISSGYPVINESGDLFIFKNDKLYEILGISDSTINTKEIKSIQFDTNGILYVCDDNFEKFYTVDDENDVIDLSNPEVDVIAEKIVYKNNRCYFLGNQFGYIENGETILLGSNVGKEVGFISINERTGYGYTTKKYNKYFVCSYLEDTELNFPNSFYYQILSYLLAISFKCKQGADITLLSQQLAMAEQTFEDTLGSDSFQYPRMGNVYN